MATTGAVVGRGDETASAELPAAQLSDVRVGDRLNVIGVHLYLEKPDGTVLLGLRHPDSAFAPSTWHVLAGHCEQESAIMCLIREAHEEAGPQIQPQDVELVHVVHHIDRAGDRPRMGLFFGARAWAGEPQLREPDKCTQ
jgi:8-oxo-dGTP pyrophosphatase MutT (NUDIX family)